MTIHDEIHAINWFHAFELDGVHTKGVSGSAVMKQRADRTFRHPVAGKSVLDIGAWDGFFSFEAERRGASRVLATDHFCWSGPGWGTKVGFDLASRILQSRVESRDIDLQHLSLESVGVFDVVLSLGVLYHLPDPFSHVHQIGKLTREMAVIETLIDPAWSRLPRLLVIKGNSRHPDSADPTNFYAPNIAAMKAMLRDAGFKRIEHEVDRKHRRGLFHAFKA